MRQSNRFCVPKGKSAQGFTLLEVIIALTILGLAILGMSQVLSANSRGILQADEYAHAVALADARMRTLLLDVEQKERTWSEQAESGHRYDITVREVMQERTRDLKMVLLEYSLTISWRAPGSQRSFTLTTMKALERRI
jgi:prepilin-type N-terminal cleavage/methylation domain-containing protein